MTNKTKKWITIAFGVYSAVLTVAYIVFLLANLDHLSISGIEFVDGLISSITLTFLGVLLSYRRPDNRISWLLVLIAFMRQTSYFYIFAKIINLAAIESTFWPLFGNLWPSFSGLTYTLLAYAIVLFPSGRPPSPRWRPATYLLGVQTILSIGLYIFVTHDLAKSIQDVHASGGEVKLVSATSTGPGALISHVREIPRLDVYLLFIAAVAFVMVVMGLLSQISQYRTGTTIVRQQIKWVMFIVAVWAIALVLVILPLGIPFTTIIFISPLIPISIAVAILRYRLYDIDLIIRRTAVYAILTGLLLVVYFGSVTLMQNLVSVVSGQESPIVIVVSTLIIAALFTPLRRRVQDFIDRRFYRQKYNSERTLSEFAEKARDEVKMDALTGELTTTIRKTLQPASLTFWLSSRQGDDQ